MYPLPECYPCFIKHAKGVLKLIGSTEDIKSVAMNIAEDIAGGYLDLPPPVITGHFQRKLKEICGIKDFYSDLKRDSNKRALDILKKIQNMISNSSNPIKTTITTCIAGNAIDFGVRDQNELKNWENDIIDMINKTSFDDETINTFMNDIRSAKKILYLLDNTGEIIFDKLLLQMLPLDKITVAVRGKPIINDALMEDAQSTGITDLARTIDNGSDIPGTWIPEVSEEFRKEFESADLIISKGMGNYETLCESERPIYFLFMVKCLPVARIANKNMGELVLFKNPKFVE